MCKGAYLYNNFANDSILGINLSIPDPYFIMPLLVFFTTFTSLKIINHPFLINYNQTFKLVILSFSFSLLTIFWPKVII